jgi:hypothetical protein
MATIKLSVEKVRNIRKLLATGNYTDLEISKRYKVSRGHICKVKNKMRWKPEHYPNI